MGYNYEHVKTREQLIQEAAQQIDDYEWREMEAKRNFQSHMEALHHHALLAGILNEGESFGPIMSEARKAAETQD